MKKLCALAAVLLLAVMLFSVAAAAAEGGTVWYPSLEVSKQNNGVLSLSFSTYVLGNPTPDFDGRTVVKASVYLLWYDTTSGASGTLSPISVQTHYGLVSATFSGNDLPTGGADVTYLFGDLINGDSFVAQGTGFQYGHV